AAGHQVSSFLQAFLGGHISHNSILNCFNRPTRNVRKSLENVKKILVNMLKYENQTKSLYLNGQRSLFLPEIK
ncbi:hypothetical protein L9F63_010087, partial [Diploptera punctata]